jgi:hypothetical protein
MPVKTRRGTPIEELESLLQATLHPVTPNPGFVQGLRTRLEDPGFVTIRYPDPKVSHYLLLAAAGLLGSTFLILTGSRLVIAILGALGLLHYSRQQHAAKPVVPARRIA